MTREQAIKLVDKAIADGWDNMGKYGEDYRVGTTGTTKTTLLALEALGLIEFEEPAEPPFLFTDRSSKASMVVPRADAIRALELSGYKVIKDAK